MAGVHVAHDGARNDHHHRPAKPLNEAPRDQQPDARRHRTEQRAEDEQPEPEEQRPPPSGLIRPGSVEQLRHAIGEEIGADRALRLTDRGPEIGGQPRHRRQIHVDRKGADTGQQPEHEGGTEESGLHHLLLSGMRAGYCSAASISTRNLQRPAGAHGERWHWPCAKVISGGKQPQGKQPPCPQCPTFCR